MGVRMIKNMILRMIFELKFPITAANFIQYSAIHRCHPAFKGIAKGKKQRHPQQPFDAENQIAQQKSQGQDINRFKSIDPIHGDGLKQGIDKGGHGRAARKNQHPDQKQHDDHRQQPPFFTFLQETPKIPNYFHYRTPHF